MRDMEESGIRVSIKQRLQVIGSTHNFQTILFGIEIRKFCGRSEAAYL